MVENTEIKLGYSQHVISIVVLVLTLFTINLPLSEQDNSILKLLASILFFVTLVYVTIVNFEIISNHLVILTQAQDSKYRNSPQSQFSELLLIQIFSLITWLFIYIGLLIFLMFILRDIRDILLSLLMQVDALKVDRNIINSWGKVLVYGIITPVVSLMIVNKYITIPLKEQIKFNIIYYPKDELIIGESYDEPLKIIIKNVGDTEIKIKELRVVFPEGVTFRLKDKEFKKHILTLNDLKQLNIPTTLVSKKQARADKNGRYKINLEIYPKYNPTPEERGSKMYDYILIHVKTDKFRPITKYLDAVITV